MVNYLQKQHFEIQNVIDSFEIQNVVFEDNLPSEIGEYIITIITINPNYKITSAQAVLMIQAHSEIHHEGKPATCTESGWESYVTCEYCDYTTYEEIEALGHNEVVDSAKPATCTEEGLTEGSHCSRCNEVLTEQEVVEKLDHVAGEWVVVEYPTCEDNGLEKLYCENCNEVLSTRVIGALGHYEIYHEGKPATCTESGWKSYVTCIYCNYTTYEEIEALGHSEVVDPSKPATCTEEGLTEGSHCSRCNEVLTEQEVTPVVGHILTDWEVDICATATTDGRYERHCINCDLTEYKTIEAYGNRDVANVEVEETQKGQTSISEESIENALVDVKETGKGELVISAENSTSNITNIEMTASSVQQIVGAESALTIKTNAICATFDKEALSSIMSSLEGETINFDLKPIEVNELTDVQRESINDVNVLSVISLQVLSDSGLISNFGEGKVQIRIPFEIAEGKSSKDYKIMYIADDGTIEELDTNYENGGLVVELSHFSEYVIVDISQPAKTSFDLVIVVVVGLLLFALLYIYLVIDFIHIARRAKKGNQ